MADRERRQDIFGNTDIGPGQSNATVAQGVPNPSKTTAIEGLQYLNPLIERVASGLSAKAEEDPNKYRSMLNAERELRASEEAALMKGGLTKEQRQLKQQEILDRYKDENPHLMEEFDKLAKRTQETYGFTKDTDFMEAKRNADKADIQEAFQLGQIPPGETNPDVIAQGVATVQKLKADVKRMDVISKQLGILQQQLAVSKSEHDASMQPLQDENYIRQSHIDKLTYELKMASGEIARQGITSSTVVANKVLAGVAAHQDSATARAEGVKALQDELVNVQNIQSQIPGIGLLDESSRQWQLSKAQAPILKAIEQLKGKDSLEVIKNSIEETKAIATFETLHGPVASQALQVGVMRALFGDSAITYNQAIQASITMMYGDGTVNADGTTNPNSLYAVDKPKEVELVYSQAGKLFKKANEATEATKAMADDAAAKAGGSIMNGLKPDASGKVDPKSVQRAVDYFADPATNQWAVRFQPKWNPEVVKSVDYLITKTYGTPAFKSIGEVLNSSLSSKKPLADSVVVMWQDGQVKIKPKEGLAPGDAKEVRAAVSKIEDKLPALTKIVRASATRHNSNDFQGFTERYANELYGVSNISNDPRSANEPMVREYMTARAAAVGSITDEGQRKIAEARYDRQNNASPQLIAQARRLEQGLSIMTPEESAANAKSDLAVLISQEEAPPTTQATQQATPQQITPSDLPAIYPPLDGELKLRASVMKKRGASQEEIDADAQEHIQELTDRFNSGQPLVVEKARR